MRISSLKIILQKVTSVQRDGIEFKNSMYVDLIIDDVSIYDNPDFSDSFIYFKELYDSTKAEGKYLIFTCACGVADDGGWEGVIVRYQDDVVIWNICGTDIIYTFSVFEYKNQVISVAIDIPTYNYAYRLEPFNVVFPESWDAR